ncbi:MAG: bifunctional metallophosphatase/5'-nucleotidase [Bacteroidales bacterium]
MKMVNTRVILLFILTLFLTACTKSGGGRGGASTSSETKKITILHVNDVHANIDNFSKLKWYVDQEQAKGTTVFLFCAGDIFSGNPVVDMDEDPGRSVIELMNACGFDAMAVGNHEFDYGKDILKSRIEQSKFPWISSNIIKKPRKFDIEESVVLEKGGVKIALVSSLETGGGNNPPIPSTHPSKVKGFKFENPLSFDTWFKGVKDKTSADLLIDLSHFGVSEDSKLAEANTDFDLIIGGHSHTKLSQVLNVNGTPIVQAGSKLWYLGRLDLEVKDRKIQELDYNLIDFRDIDNKDENLKNRIAEIDDAPALKEVIGLAKDKIDKPYEVGCLYTDALKIGLKCDVAIQNVGGIRAYIDEGDITLEDVFKVDPFGNGAVTCKMTYGDLKKIMETYNSEILVSGISYTRKNGKVELLSEDGKAVNLDQSIKVATNDYLYEVLKDSFPKKCTQTGTKTVEVIIDYIKSFKMEPISYDDCKRFEWK